jgi:hypothetical protein
MDGRVMTALLGLLLPIVLIGVTVAEFSDNPLALLILFTVMVVAAFYLLTYRETFGQ